MLTREETEALIQEVLEVYPEKAKKDRAKHLAVNDQSIEQSKKCITSNRKSVPGVMTQRGCAYAGARGVVWGPFKDIIAIGIVVSNFLCALAGMTFGDARVLMDEMFACVQIIPNPAQPKVIRDLIGQPEIQVASANRV